MTEAGPLRGTPPRLCTMASKALCRFGGMFSRVAVGILAMLRLLLEDCCGSDTAAAVYRKDATASSAPVSSGLTAAHSGLQWGQNQWPILLWRLWGDYEI